jgi:hypothetical protein
MALRPCGHLCSTNRRSLNLPLSLSPSGERHECHEQTPEAALAPVA